MTQAEEIEIKAQTGKIIVAVDDMFFAAKILGAAQNVGKQVERVKSKEQLVEAVSTHPVALVILDLNSAQFKALEIIEMFKATPTFAAIPLLGFLSHVQLDLKRQAEQMGCDYVLARSFFSQTLPEILSGKMPKSPAKNS